MLVSPIPKGTYRGDIHKSGIKHQYVVYFHFKKPKYFIHLIPFPFTPTQPQLPLLSTLILIFLLTLCSPSHRTIMRTNNKPYVMLELQEYAVNLILVFASIALYSYSGRFLVFMFLYTSSGSALSSRIYFVSI